MGSLKDEMRVLGEDLKPCEKADDGERPGGSDGSAEPEPEPQINISQESTGRGDCEQGLCVNAGSPEGREENPLSKDEELSGGTSDDVDQSDVTGVEGSARTGTVPLMQPPETTEPTSSTNTDNRIPNGSLSDGGSGMQGEWDKNMDGVRGKGPKMENISVPVLLTPGASDPCSPAPAGQHHMRTQVSLEVIQCQSAATSPMTPAEGGHSFLFPSALGKCRDVGADDAEPQAAQRVEFCSVATSPMTPKMPHTTAFPELVGREVAPRAENVSESEGHQRVLEFATSSEDSSPESAINRPAANQQRLQQKMGSMDQDITIMVTHYSNNEEEEEEEESTLHPTEAETVKIDEDEERGGSYSEVSRKDGEGTISRDAAPHISAVNPPGGQAEDGSASKTGVKVENPREELQDVSSMKPHIPESPAPFGCHHVRTQVSLEVVQCRSAATSPMTPPEGDQAFLFPTSFGTSAGTRDAELQVGQQVEYRSVATAPMTPRTPTATTFPEIGKEKQEILEEEEEEEDKKQQVVEEKEEAVEDINVASTEEDRKELEEEDKEGEVKEEVNESEEEKEAPAEGDRKEGRNCKEKGEEPVQEVSWDEKGMTWEVYGAVVEVTVLGSAIQKHLEKQVKKRQPSMPPPPPLDPSAVPLSPEAVQGGSTKGRAGKRRERDGEVSRRRRNPFRLMMENMQQPHCCSKAHTTE